MGPVKFSHLVSCSSEDPNQPAENLVKDGAYRKWRSKTVGEPKVWAELQLEKTCNIQSVDIGNHGSAFVEVLVGRTGCTEDDYKVLLNSASFMTPIESRNETNLQRVRMFRLQELNKATLTEKWDRIRVVCTQPFNKQLKYGLSFITVHNEEEEAPQNLRTKSETGKEEFNLGMFKLKEPSTDPIRQGSVFSRFKTSGVRSSLLYDSPSSKAGAIRAASQSLATVALAQSKEEAASILKPSPKKEERPIITLCDKVKGTSEVKSLLQHQKLPSRKIVERDESLRVKKAETKVPSPKPKLPSRKVYEPDLKSLKDDQKTSKQNTGNEPNKKVTPPTATKRKSPVTPTTSSEEPAIKKSKTTKPFNQLFEGVVVALSGFQNPLRGQLRDKLLAMGAKYKPDWNNFCTHLICAFYNTPKFREVKGKGKITTKNWVEESYSQRKRLPWRRFCLDKNDKGEESEEEIWEKSPNSSSTSKDSEDYGGSTDVDDPDTEDEIEMTKKKMKEEFESNSRR